jgi:hypothetical protein
MPFRRRREIWDWSKEQLEDHVRAAYAVHVKDSEWESVTAALVVDQDPSLLPRRAIREAMETGMFKRFITLDYFADTDHIVAFEEGTRSTLIAEDTLNQVQGFDSLRDARAHAQSRVPEARELEFRELPDIIQVAFVHGTATAWGTRASPTG